MSLDDWLHAAADADDDELRERILTGFRSGKPFTPYRPTVALPGYFPRVLDFGCGLGRNFPYLRTISDAVVGFDLPPMIARCRSLPPAAGVTLVDDWPALQPQRFDLVFAALVLQHIDGDARRTFLQDFARIAPVVYVLTRGASDDDGNVIADIEQAGFEIAECREVEHDPATHQLRVVRGEAPVADARRDGNASHFELLLRPVRR